MSDDAVMTMVEGEVHIFTTKRMYVRCHKMLGYMFEQSRPSLGIEYKHPATTLESEVLLHKLLCGAPMDKVVCHDR